ncbi:MAG: hypothetical protein AB1690_09540 [Candidatus Zixiibacteriota bacterium]|jgi:hypothetical protein
MNIRRSIILLSGLVLTLLLISGCSEKIVAPGPNGAVTISMKIDAAQASQSISRMLVYVVLPERETDQLLVDSLIEKDGYFVGELAIPAGRDRRFIVEGIGMGRQDVPVLLYKGETVADVLPGIITRLSIDLYPVVPMVKLVPRYLEIPFETTFRLDLVVYNLNLLDSAEFGVFYDIGSLHVDSVVRNRSLGDAVSEVDIKDITGTILQGIVIWHVSPLGTIVNTKGNATLLSIFMSNYPMIDTTSYPDTTYFGVYPTHLSTFIGETIPVNDVYYESSKIVVDNVFGVIKPKGD